MVSLVETTASEDSSLREVWKLLENGSNISIKSAISDVQDVEEDLRRSGGKGDLQILGEPIKQATQRVEIATKKATTKFPVKKRQSNKKAPIRNYNQRD